MYLPRITPTCLPDQVYSWAHVWSLFQYAHILHSLAPLGGISCLRGSYPYLWCSQHQPPSSTYTRALERTYLERRCVHACTQLCTGGYTIVYTRVYFCLLGSSYILGQYIARVQVFLSSVQGSRLVALRALVFSRLSPEVYSTILIGEGILSLFMFAWGEFVPQSTKLPIPYINVSLLNSSQGKLALALQFPSPCCVVHAFREPKQRISNEPQRGLDMFACITLPR